MSLQEREANGILAMGRVLAEYQTAVRQYGPFHSCHEGLAVVQEEFEELKAEVFKKPARRFESDGMPRQCSWGRWPSALWLS